MDNGKMLYPVILGPQQNVGRAHSHDMDTPAQSYFSKIWDHIDRVVYDPRASNTNDSTKYIFIV